jgi:hypothetical protein
MSSHASVAVSFISSNKSEKRTPLGSLNVNHSNIHLSQITVDTAHVVDSALSPGAPAGHQANSAITGKPSTATNWMCLVRNLFRAPHITTLIPHKFS